jgi:hypothetical protein
MMAEALHCQRPASAPMKSVVYPLIPSRLCRVCGWNNMHAILSQSFAYQSYYVLHKRTEECDVCKFLIQCLPVDRHTNSIVNGAVLESRNMADLLKDGGLTVALCQNLENYHMVEAYLALSERPQS